MIVYSKDMQYRGVGCCYYSCKAVQSLRFIILTVPTPYLYLIMPVGDCRNMVISNGLKKNIVTFSSVCWNNANYGTKCIFIKGETYYACL